MDNNLDNIANNSLYTTMTGKATMLKSFEIFMRSAILHGNILELGPAEGLTTDQLSNHFNDITVVDGSQIYCNSIRERFPHIDVINDVFENFKTHKKFDNIILGHVLEHVDDPVLILKRVKELIKPEGVIWSAVPNSRSLHRQAAVIMGLLDRESSMSELDFHHGHKRVFSPESFRDIFYQANLKIAFFGGYWLKPISNSQIEESWSEEMLECAMSLGERYPDIAGEIYIVSKI